MTAPQSAPSSTLEMPDGRARRQRVGWLGLAALVVALFVALPIVSVGTNVFSQGTGGTWAHLASTVLPDYITTTLWLCIGVGTSAAVIGVGTAWLVTHSGTASTRTPWLNPSGASANLCSSRATSQFNQGFST